MTKERAITLIESRCSQNPRKPWGVEYKNACKMAIKSLEHTTWIPVSERLPEEFADVLCSTDSEEIFIATYLGKMNDGKDCFDDNDGMMWEGDVIAWMPLPEPYNADKERKE